nr:MAG: replication initiator protein [Microvirus sp.]
MPCYTPLSAWKANSVNPKTGKRAIVFGKIKQAFHDLPITLPCGRCVGCRLERSRQWAIRAMHEAQMHKHSAFVTLTYSDEALQKKDNLVLKELQHEDFQLFMKRLRKRFGAGIRYYMCGEYGEKFGRPHFHAAIYGVHFKDKKLFKARRGQNLYTSAMLTDIWGHGHASFGKLTFNSAAYIARYIMKKVIGPSAADHYERLDEFGEYIRIQPEYQQASRRPGLAKAWFDKFHGDIYPKDSFHIGGTEMRPPKYYDLQFEIASPAEMATIKQNRRSFQIKNPEDQTRERLDDRWKIAEINTQKLKRNLDNET